MKELLGGKGAGLAEMSRLGLDVPAGFTLSTELCAMHAEAAKRGGEEAAWAALDASVWDEVDAGVRFIEDAMGRAFPGNPSRHGDDSKKGFPLLLSVRSGAAASMPGMLDTVLNLGLNEDILEAFCSDPATTAQERRFARDAYRRLLEMFADVVLAIPRADFEGELQALKQGRQVQHDADLAEEDLKVLCSAFKGVYAKHAAVFPSDPLVQLRMAIQAVLKSWNNPRAVKYRAINRDCSDLVGTAVNVQAMVFGNRDQESCSGVCFTRDPGSGLKALYGEYLPNAQGEDVVAGIRTPQSIDQLKKDFPQCHATLTEWCVKLEAHYWDMMDIEFTVESSRPWILQCRSGKRTGAAAVKIAVDMVDEALVPVHRALLMVQIRHLDQLLRPCFDAKYPYGPEDVVARGLPASSGAAVGKCVFTAAEAERCSKRGEDCILIRTETSAEDVGGMNAAKGILTARGGVTSHAAVVARGWGKPCVVGCEDMRIHEGDKIVKFPRAQFREHDIISLDGGTGSVIRGARPLTLPDEASADPNLARIMRWADEVRVMNVLANADTPEDAAVARINGAQGIGLVRTEHQFFSSVERLRAMRAMVLASDDDARASACEQMLQFQREDFAGIFEAMAGLPVCVRLLDPPLHEFLPPRHSEELERVALEVAAGSKSTPSESVASVLERAEQLREFNPMLGLRGCRLGISHPEVTAMQCRAIFLAAKECMSKGIKVRPQVMVPLVSMESEFEHQMKIVRDAHGEVFGGETDAPACEVGAMVETPRAALITEDLVRAGAQFLSLGTNDLTQMTFGMSRDDVAPIIRGYVSSGIMADDFFEHIDTRGVGKLIETCIQDATVQVGVCGEHGGDPQSIEFFASKHVNYVSCSTNRVVAARLAAAQAEARATELRPPRTEP